MDSQIQASTIFANLKLSPSNNKCLDCEMPEPIWASVNNGIFICTQCAESHKSLGTSISFIRSIEHDTWTQSYLSLMAAGGNQKFLDFISIYGLNSKEIEEKYPTVAAQFYRKQLKAAANNQEFDENTPRISEGCNLIPRTNEKFSGVDLNEEGKGSKVKQALSNFGQKIKNSAKEFSEKPKVKEISEKTQGWFDKVGGKMKEIVRKGAESQAYLIVKEKSKQAVEAVKVSAKKTFEKARGEEVKE